MDRRRGGGETGGEAIVEARGGRTEGRKETPEEEGDAFL